jgi:hypothetical protein
LKAEPSIPILKAIYCTLATYRKKARQNHTESREAGQAMYPVIY